MTSRSAAGTVDALGHYERGASTYFAAQCDQRFGYYLYVPQDFELGRSSDYRLCVLVHGTGRTPSVYRDLFAGFADANRSIIVAPLFPAGIIEPGELANYKFIAFHDIRYDQVLNGIVDEVAARFRLAERRFLLFGYSGGGHFAHRYFYLHPSRLLGVSIGAPGMVTLLDERLPWWRGVADLEARFGVRLDFEMLRRVPVQMIVGEEDKETWEITIEPTSRFWMEGANDAGPTRIDRLRALRDDFARHGIPVRFDLVPGVAHNGYAVLDPVQDFFGQVLQRHSGPESREG
jgi:pimeloyl-ACP methyl ester carboxylesterase